MNRELEHKRQLQIEIDWLKNKLQTQKMSVRQRKTYEHQIKKKEYDLVLGVFPK